MRCVFFTLCLLFSFNSFSQSRKSKRRISNNKGAIYGSFGYNRSAYSKTNAHFEGSGYNYNLKYSKAHDNQSKLGSGDYLNFTSQFNIKLGYYYMKEWSICLSFDHMKYYYSNNNNVSLTGFVSMDATTVDFGDGQIIGSGYNGNLPVVTLDDKFSYQTTKGFNFVHADLDRTKKLLSSGKRDVIVLTGSYGIGLGALLTTIDFNYAGSKTTDMYSFSGYGLAVNGGLRLEFYKRVYLYSTFSTGFQHQVHVKTRMSDPTAYSSQFYGFSQIEAGVGFLLYKRSKNGCDDCPIW